jgi:hypothetical protein
LRLLRAAVRNGALASSVQGRGYTCPCSDRCKPQLLHALDDVVGEPPLTPAERAWLHRTRRCKAKFEQFATPAFLEVGRDYFA